MAISSASRSPQLARLNFWVALLFCSLAGLQIASAASLQITTQPQSQTVLAGQRAYLSVRANQTNGITYQWYEGTTGTTSAPQTDATNRLFHTPQILKNTYFWAQVSSNRTLISFTNIVLSTNSGVITTNTVITLQTNGVYVNSTNALISVILSTNSVEGDPELSYHDTYKQEVKQVGEYEESRALLVSKPRSSSTLRLKFKSGLTDDFDATTAWTFSLGSFSFSGNLGDDREYKAGKKRAKIRIYKTGRNDFSTTNSLDLGDGDPREVGYIKLKWSKDKLHANFEGSQTVIAETFASQNSDDGIKDQGKTYCSFSLSSISVSFLTKAKGDIHVDTVLEGGQEFRTHRISIHGEDDLDGTPADTTTTTDSSSSGTDSADSAAASYQMTEEDYLAVFDL